MWHRSKWESTRRNRCLRNCCKGIEPLLKEVVSLTEKIKELDRRVEQIAREDWMLEAAYGVCHSARPEPWYPCVFTSPEEAAEAGVCAVNPIAELDE